ncbi:ABC transporter ATP-binding protein [Paraclostridium sordellii]|uniref:ABC transporter ATP-binding protein n=1 Tax=Paraclostridium sordellii TaxID=1505 RepID=A0A0C7R8F6_PARSO|nr:ABC transporter ATP-binding protein [Paeniclostridium sordellii]CEN21301.1 ABC transporter ATP-binding protein [[Clostridium] sordellii] [Paeniclostridium sordellii]CEN79116.1 ABC transporter ATP-binding protein [[Clostridium] sordellii] [Paeniclostridium sordellii]CEP88493.1 ABC transporter ATP-binding protein [[Clostridium] sordellii] [Paeniclostridium sordellii]CEP96952.1 ABC transporter ATP-binding protein [[Clostridium] sordellii] [Paeniclostridium sordellii]CEQ00640.1 ABC transporter 
MNKLEIVNLTKSYKHKNANENINLTLESGVYGLLGPNGAGKTTLMKQIATLKCPTSGKILYNGKDINSLDDKYREVVGYLPQDFDAYKNFSAKDFLLYIGALKGMRKDEAKIKTDKLLNLVGLHEVRNKAISKFSGGMKRRVGIAQALLNDPKVLILDEPTAGLDPQERARFRNLLSQIGKETIVILSTHIISDIESVAKETIMIKDGKVLLQGTHKEILDDMRGKVYSLTVESEDEVYKIQNKYKVVNIQRGVSDIELRVISEIEITDFKAKSIEPRFEDVYMFYFDLEDAREV